MSLDIKLLEDFISLVRFESFTLAAQERRITQSALSRRIKALENWLGTNLIRREQKAFSLTPQGRIFLTEAEIVLRRLYNAREAACVISQNRDREITVAAQNSIAQTFFSHWVKNLETQLDNVYIRLISEKFTDCIELFNRGDINYLFCYANSYLAPPIDSQKYSYLTIGKELLIPVSAPKQNGEPVFKLPGSQKNPLSFVAYVHDSIFGKAVDALIQNNSDNCHLLRRYENPYSHTLKSLANEKLGIAWLPESSIREDFDRNSLCRAGDTRWDIEFDIRMYYHHDAKSEWEVSIQQLSLQIAKEEGI